MKYRKVPFFRAVNFANLPKNKFCGSNFREFMPPGILYRNNLIFAEVIFVNLQEIAKFTVLKKRSPTVHSLPTSHPHQYQSWWLYIKYM